VTLQDPAANGEDWNDPYEIDTSVAHAARRYNYWLGGSVNFEADRISGETWAAAFPTVRIAARENRRFLHRAVTFLVKEAGIRQFLDIGTGIPSADNVHEVAQSIEPDIRVVYVDNDPIVLAHARRLLDSTPGGATAYIHADLHDPAAILGNADLRGALDLSRPVALMLIAVLHFLQDDEAPYAKVATLTGALAPGSYLAMSHGTADFIAPEARAAFDVGLERDRRLSRAPSTPRDRAAFARFFAGMELVPPGVVALPDWRSELPHDERPSAADVSCYSAVARIR
jgi:S-adenosyl methyltransferase